MKEIDASKCACHQWKYMLAMKCDTSLYTDMWKDVTIPQLTQYELCVVCVGTKILEAM